MTDHNHVRRGCHYHVRRGYVRLYESWFDSMSRWFDHELPQPRPTWLWLPRPFPPGSSSARRSSFGRSCLSEGVNGTMPLPENEQAGFHTVQTRPSPRSVLAPRAFGCVPVPRETQTAKKIGKKRKRFKCSGGARGPPEAPCAAQQCGNGAPALLVSTSTDFPNDHG